ncbi:MAG: caspase family protein, partial [Chloroflexi bacterium]|nr:caspase family protein [Chloroflexota bacterium]
LVSLLLLTLSIVQPAGNVLAESGNAPAALAGSKCGTQQPPVWSPPSSSGLAATGTIGTNVTGKRYAILVGISDYPGQGTILEGGMDLYYAANDADLMYNVLCNGYGFEPVHPNDEVVFYFSGHGDTYTPGRGLQRWMTHSGIVCWAKANKDRAGFATLWDTDLQQAFWWFPTNRIVFIFDCCYAGGMTDLAGYGRVVCMAATQDGISAEYGEAYVPFYGDLAQGLPVMDDGMFTYFFAAAGMFGGQADVTPGHGQLVEVGNGDGLVTVEEAFDYANGWLSYISLMAQQNGFSVSVPLISDLFCKDLLL